MYTKKQLSKIKEQLEKSKFSGVVSIKIGEDKIFEEARGYLDHANRIRNNINTRFAIASGTKLFTSLGIMRLIESGEIKLDDAAFNYIPSKFPKYDQSVTIQQLLTHTSGIPDYYDEEIISDFETFELDIPWYELLKPSDYLQVMPRGKMKFKPDAKFSYNNSAFVFLAIIIEQLTGNYHQWIQKEVLNRAKMNNSGFFMLDRLPTNTANGYIELDLGLWKTNIYSLPIIGGGDGGLFSTADDVIKFWENLMSGNIVHKKTLEQILHPYVIEKDFAYGLGVWLKKEKNTYIPYIVGGDPGISFKSYYDPQKKITISVISNTTKGAGEIAPLLYDNI